MKRLILILCINLFGLILFAQPKDNPVASHYNNSEGYPTWTDRIHWERTMNMQTYTNGANDFEKFENARDEMFAQGGGVLYYPAGTYNFSNAPVDGPNGRGLMLKSGVVIRGEAPIGDKNAADGTLSLGTKFIFPMRNIEQPVGTKIGEVPGDWNFVGIKPDGVQKLKDINDVGIVWVNLVGATVYFGPDLNWTSSWSTTGSWYASIVKGEDRNGYNWKNRVADGTHPIDPFAGSNKGYVGAGSGRLVFGCQLDDAAVMNNGIDYGSESSIKLNSVVSPYPNKDFFFQYKFGARICVHGQHVFVANNVIPISTKNFKFSQVMGNTKSQANASSCVKDCSTIQIENTIFDYGKQHGIDINKDLLGWNLGTPLDAFGNYESPGLYEEDVVVRDNWIFNHGHKGYNISGKWVIVKNNHNERLYLQEGAACYGLTSGWMLSSNGFLRTAMGNGCISENFSRAFDMAGQAGWIDHNTYNNTGSVPGCDGEGILWQHHGGTQFNSYSVTYNTQIAQTGNGCGSGNPGYQAGWDVNVAGAFIAWNKSYSFIGATGCSGAKKEYDAVYINIPGDAQGGIRVCNAANDVVTTCSSGSSPKPTITNVNKLADSTGVVIEWTDNSTYELAFRIERSIGDSLSWDTIAYRPRKSAGCVQNEQKWVDYLAPRNVKLYYRVIAVNCENDNSGATYATLPLVISNVNYVTTATETYLQPSDVVLYPVPSSQRFSISILNSKNENFDVTIFTITGAKIKTQIHLMNHQSIEVGDLQNGVYLVEIKTNNVSVFKKLIIKN